MKKDPKQKKVELILGTIILGVALYYAYSKWTKYQSILKENKNIEVENNKKATSEKDSLNTPITITIDGVKKQTTIKNRIEDSLYYLERKKFNNSKAGNIKSKHKDWTDEECENLANNRIWIGMSYEMLIYMRGKPNTVNTSNYGNGNEYQCCWERYNPSCFYLNADKIVKSYN